MNTNSDGPRAYGFDWEAAGKTAIAMILVICVVLAVGAGVLMQKGIGLGSIL